MHDAIDLSNDTAVLQSLLTLRGVDTSAGSPFSHLTRLLQRAFHVPFAVIKLDGQPGHEYLPAELKADLGEQLLVVPDAQVDPRFSTHALVRNAPHVRFFARYPLHAVDRRALGTMCIADPAPRPFADSDEQLLHDMARVVESEIASRSLSITDELTQLLNRRGFLRVADQCLAGYRRLGAPVVLMLFDLDGFKSVNDTEGHQAGDRLLQQFARRAVRCFRDSDMIARLGGDEFCVLLPGSSLKDTEVPLRRFRDFLSGRHPGDRPIRFSVGVVEFNATRHLTIDQLVDEADRAMFTEKRRRAGPG